MSLVSKDFFKERLDSSVVMISGAFEPLHIGHINYILEARKLADKLIAVVNGDGFLSRKNRSHFQNEIERATVVDNIKGVDFTIIWDDETQFVDKALLLIKPDVFAKGPGRKVPEIERSVCESIGTRIVYNVGGKNRIIDKSELLHNLEKLSETH